MQKRNTISKLLSFFLTLAVGIGLMPGMALTAYAADSLSSTTTTWDKDYELTEDLTINDTVTVTKDIKLTISEGKTLTVNGGIDATEYTLTVSGNGTLKVFGNDGVDGNNGSTDGAGDNSSPVVQ